MLVMCSFSSFGQTEDTTIATKAKQNKLILDELVEKHISLNKKEGTIKGYRVQIFFDSGNRSKDKAYKVQADFLLKYPDINAYVSFQAPNYRVRVGDFRNAVEAQGFVEKLKSEYPNAYYVQDKIELPAL